MPSKAALLIIQKLEDYLGRALTQQETILAEEMNINFFTNAICGYVDRLMRRGAPKDFDLVYHPIMNGTARGAYRRRDIIRMKGRFLEVYNRLHALTGDGFTNAELESILFLAGDCTDKELNAAIAVARTRGIHHVNYIRAVIEGNRKAASRARATKDLKQYIPDDYGKREAVTVPRVDAIRDSWRERLSSAKEKVRLAEAELNAKKKLKH